MRVFKNYLSLVAIVALLFASCSKEDAVKNDPGGETATLSFATMLNGMMAKSQALKQQEGMDLPECSDAVPAYVEIILTGPDPVGAEGAPEVINIGGVGDYDGDGEDEYFTEFDTDLELTPGEYQLQHFVVFDADGNVIWIAPKDGGEFASFVDDALPIDITLDAGVKLYVDVEVLCFDDRVPNLYGYLFFEIETTELQEVCFFLNYCDENGRHFTASYTVNFGILDSEESDGQVLYTDMPNVTGWTQGDDPEAYADPLCFAIPTYEGDNPDEPYYYYTITLQDWEDNYGNVEDGITITGTLSQNQIEDMFGDDDTVDYIHLAFGCDGIPPGGQDPQCPWWDRDCDCVPDFVDQCPDVPGNGFWGCPVPE